MGTVVKQALVYGEFPLRPMAPVGKLRARSWGKPKAGLGTRYDTPSINIIGHHCWTFLDDSSRRNLVNAVPTMQPYIAARRRAFVHRSALQELREPRPEPSEVPPLCPVRARRMAAALITFDFNYGDLIRWLGGDYTNQQRDWSELLDAVAAIRSKPVPPGQPPIDFDRCVKLCTEGAPLQGTFECAWEDTRERIRYDNHPPLSEVEPAVREKFAKEEAKSFHIHLPKWVAYFVQGLFISPISWLVRKGKGRIVIDSSTLLRPEDTGAPNTYIPPVGTEGREDECPAVHFGTALRRHLERIWNLRIDHPREDLLQHGDDIDAAFRRVLYHPDIAAVFAYVFMEYLIIPVGMIFGARNSPSNFCLLAELRAFIGNTTDFHEDRWTPLTDQLALPPDITAEESALIPPAVPDDIHQGVQSAPFSERSHLTMYVDDNVVVEVRQKVTPEVRRAEGSAYVVFGRPGQDRRGAVLQDEKWEHSADFEVHHLGFDICTRRMQVSWPNDKRQSLKEAVEVILSRQRCRTTPIEVAVILGLLRNGATVCPLGNFLSIRLQHCLSDAIHRAGAIRSIKRQWWRSQAIFPTPDAIRDLRLLFNSLGRDELWHRPIALLIRRAITALFYSDASYQGLGGWSPTFHICWRLSRQDLADHGFSMKLLDKLGEPANPKAPGLHINPLEFIAIIINIWFCVWAVKKDPSRAGGHIARFFADNTSALSWLAHAARSHKPEVRHLAWFAHALLLYSQTSQILAIHGKHLPGIENDEADAFSRYKDYPTVDSVIAAFSHLETFPCYLIPSSLLSLIANLLSSARIGAQHEARTMQILTVEPTIMQTGSRSTPYAPGYWRRSHRGRRKR